MQLSITNSPSGAGIGTMTSYAAIKAAEDILRGGTGKRNYTKKLALLEASGAPVGHRSALKCWLDRQKREIAKQQSPPTELQHAD